MDKNRNRLAGESSPYLQQHASNPVDWYPWGEEAIAEARRRNVPIFLSIGYSACHWCHVMERESFENADIADSLNKNFVSIKVDREERPDLDEMYMRAVQMMAGHGGWPMSVFLTPELKPFHGGTYYPPESRSGLPGFADLLKRIIEVWNNQQATVVGHAEDAFEKLKDISELPLEKGQARGRSIPVQQLFKNCERGLRKICDRENGGFGNGPKFPQTDIIGFLLHESYRDERGISSAMANSTLAAIACGGIRDHVGGGFHRYATDAEWRIPHFEKMLYDNALLVLAFLDAYQLKKDSMYSDAASTALNFVLRELRDVDGGFHSALDADSPAGEGAFYLWTWDEIVSVLGETDGPAFCDCYNVSKEGNFDGANILYLENNVRFEDEAFETLNRHKEKLLSARDMRPCPRKDDKVLASWNGMMISALARGGRVLMHPEYLDAARDSAAFIRERMICNGELWHAYKDGESKISGFLDDYANVVLGFIDLYESTFEVEWLREAESLTEKMIELFWDNEGEGFFSTSRHHKDLLIRTKPLMGSAEPSGNAIAAFALLRLARLLDKSEYTRKAEEVIELAYPLMVQSPTACCDLLGILSFNEFPSLEIAIVGARESEDTEAMIDAVFERYLPNKTVVFLDPSSEESQRVVETIPMLHGREMINGKATAYVCKDKSCREPVTKVEDLKKSLVSDLRPAS